MFPRASLFRALRSVPSLPRTLYIPRGALMPVKYISADELAAIVKSKKANEEYVVVDVRDDDFRGGNIRGARNAPSRSFSDAVTTLAEDTRNVPLVVFHCMLSQERGPKAARIYAETRDRLQAEGEDGAHEVCVLRDGFGGFQAKFKDDSELVENYDAKAWRNF